MSLAPRPANLPDLSAAPYLAGLNPEQHAAVTAENGPLLILAGAGTGKTRVLTTRLAHLLMTGRVRPFEILAVTFTNKAAREMVHRVEALIGQSVQGMWLGTFHAMGTRLLRRHAEIVGLKPSFTILDTDDQIRLLKQVLQALEIDDKRWPARAVLGIVQRWKDRGWTPDKVPPAEVGDFAGGKTLRIYSLYQERLATLNACDFGDLLLHCLELFRKAPDVLAQYQRRFRAILVDEYQDTNVAQYLLLRLLAQEHRNITCVGDDDQSIYSWRGAEVGNILRFEEDFPGAGVVRLERNYRSTGHILGAAAGLIARNRARHDKTLWTEDVEGEKVRVASLWDEQEEAVFVGDELEALQRAKKNLADAAVLVRAGHQTRAFEERFIQLGLPYRVIGGLRFYERAEIRDAIAYLRVVVQPDDDLAFERIVNTPKRGIGETTVQALRKAARASDKSVVATAEALLGTDELPTRGRKQLADILAAFARWRDELPRKAPRDLVEAILDESGYVGMWQADRSPEAQGRLENLKELVKAIEEFESLPAFLEHVSLVMDNAADSDGDMVTLMTLHAAKGLEYDHVFLTGWEEGLFPNQRALDEGGTKALEEERRLAYVGITRARKRCTICYAANRRIFGQWGAALPSRFVEELPPEHIHHLLRSNAARPDVDPTFGVASLFPTGKMGGRGPGFERAGKVIEGRAELVRPRPAPSVQFGMGERVFHDKFGPGTVQAIEGDKLTIAFDKAGVKKVIASFLEKKS
ncbi:ATP-dependent helicase [Geminicoccus roseus]|uniref:ATP-dependent helicase n=1 Tax=Geminicoccus roseus TaxID=404900 RepID=UPI000417A1DE|nr:UvrD-helicase domain-containing protein [Geminicoccus roseus]